MVVDQVGDIFSILEAVCVDDFGASFLISRVLNQLFGGENKAKSIDIATCDRKFNVVFWATQA